MTIYNCYSDQSPSSPTVNISETVVFIVLGLRAIKTYIRTKSGKLVERIVFLSEEDYQAFKKGGQSAEDILKKYLSAEEGQNLVSWDKDEQKAITTWVRTKSGRRVQKLVYVSKDDYDALKRGDVDATELLKKYIRTEDGETIEGWGEAELKAVKTMIRTKSGRLVEKTILVSKEDYEKMQKLAKEGKDPMEILSKYLSLGDGEKLESWKKDEKPPMKVVKAMVRTKSGRLVEKTILMTEEEYGEFMKTGGDANFLKKFLDLGKDDVIEDWEKASTVYAADSDDEDLKKGDLISLSILYYIAIVSFTSTPNRLTLKLILFTFYFSYVLLFSSQTRCSYSRQRRKYLRNCS